jgi:DNA-binding HxlR family transcriptional regulator
MQLPATSIGPPAAATRSRPRVIVRPMLATETSPAETHRLKTSDRMLIDRVTRGFDLLQGKWKVDLIVAMARGIRRHGHLYASLPGISKKVMTECLRGLERDGLVTRRIYAQVPVRVEYGLTPLGWAITDVIVALSEWSDEHRDDLARARSKYWQRRAETDDLLHAGHAA